MKRTDGSAIELLDYQYAVVTSNSRFTWNCWARQTGKSFTLALRRLVRGMVRRRTQIILSAGMRQTREVMEKLRSHCAALKIWCEFHEYRFYRDLSIRQLEILLPSDIRIIGLPANPMTARGLSGDVFLDEFAMHGGIAGVIGPSYTPAMARKPSSKKPAPSPRATGRPSSLLDTRVIYCGDNLEQLAKLPDTCVDLIYIDPPFNSNRNYEVFWGESKEKRAFEDRHASTAAYIDYMRPRCVELARVLKKTGSFYYHCDWHASHYVKVMLDQLFGENYLVNEIVWKRTTAHSDAKQGSKHLGRVHDTIFLYAGAGDYTFNHAYKPYDPAYVESFYKYVEEKTGRRYQLDNITGPGGESKGNPQYEFLGVTRFWRYSRERMKQLFEEGRIVQTKPGAVPRFKRYLDEGKGVAIGTVWDDINPVQSSAEEGLGYPTQKPLALLERILNLSSNPNDILLDAFCGCGTALVAAQNLGRQWIGIDISPTACRVMAKRLRDVCHLPENEKQWLAGKGFVVRDLPWTIDKLRAIPPFEFENWAVIALGGIPNKVQVGDMGIDGRIFPVGTKPAEAAAKGRKGATDHMFAEDWFPIQVKQMDKVGRPDIDAFEAVMHREERQRGFFVAFGFSSDAERECAAFHKKSGRIIKLITVQEILDEHHVQKM